MAKSKHRTKNGKRRSRQSPRARVPRSGCDSGPVETVDLTRIEITTEPVPLPSERTLPSEARKRFDDLLHRVHTGSCAEHIEAIQAMRAEFPDQPKLYNFLAQAHHELNRPREARRLIRETHQRFPDYLFGFTSYLRLLLLDGELDEAERLLDGRYTLTQFAPRRRKFHVSELTSYHAAVGQYCCARGDYGRARAMLEPLLEIAPAHPTVLAFASTLRSATGDNPGSLDAGPSAQPSAVLRENASAPGPARRDAAGHR